MTATLIPNAEDQRIAEQLALAKALREQGMSGTGGSGYNGGRVYMVGNQGGNLAKMLGGAAMQYFGDKNRSALDATRQQQEADWMVKRPSATTDYAPEGPTQDGGNLPVVALPKSAAQRAQETADWAMQGQGIHTPLAQTMAQFGMQHALTAPEKQADRETMIEAQKQSALAKAIEAGEQAAANRQSREDMIRMNIEGRQDLARLAASLRQAPVGADPELQELKKELIRAQIGKAGQPSAASTKPPTESEAKATQYGTRMADAHNVLNDTPEYNQAWVTASRGSEKVPGVGMAVNALAPESAQKITTAQRQFVNGSLRRDSGAAISDSEWADANRRFFPQPGEGAAILAQKKAAREREIATMQGSAGRIGGPVVEEARKGIAPVAPTRVDAPPATVSYGGKNYRLKPGADPKLKSSYEEVQ